MKKRKIIDVCNIDTYPKKLISSFEKNMSYDECYKIISNYLLLSFHFTRLFLKDDVIQNGLKMFDINNTVNYVLDIYNKVYNNNEDCLKIKESIANYIKQFNTNDDGIIFNSKQHKLCFISGRSKQLKDYEFFSYTFGGELISNATKIYEFHDKLISIGNPYCVKFFVPISYIKKTLKGYQIESLINIMKNNYKKKENKIFEGFLYGFDIDSHFIDEVVSIENYL